MNIMVCYDGSDVVEDALKLARKHAKDFNAKIYLVTSMEGGPEVPKEDFEKAEKKLETAKRSVKSDDIACETLLSVRGLEAGENLVKLAEEKEIDQIYIGVRRRSKVGKFIFGSTAQYLILEAPCPVVTVK